MSNIPPGVWEAQEKGTLVWLVVLAGTQCYYCLAQPRHCQEYEPGLEDKQARVSEDQCLGAPGKVGKDSAACQFLTPHPSGEVKGLLPHELSGDAHQGLSQTTQALMLPRAPLSA